MTNHPDPMATLVTPLHGSGFLSSVDELLVVLLVTIGVLLLPGLAKEGYSRLAPRTRLVVGLTVLALVALGVVLVR